MQFQVQMAASGDAETIASHRRSMFLDMGYRDAAALDAMVTAFLPWLRAKMDTGEYLAWLAMAEDGSVAAGAGLWLMDWPPHMVGPGARRGNILNVYTRLDCRRQGLARRLTETALNWCRDNGIRAVILHASEAGRPLYTAMGFQPTNEMRLTIEC
jgi:GNAT superfamily N-acetyltransferase